MTDHAAPVLNNELELQYIRVALGRLADDYEEQQEPDNVVGAVRALVARYEAQTAHTGLSPERQQHFQAGFMQAAAQGEEAAQAVLEEWWTELLRTTPDPAAELAPMLVALMRNTGNQTALAVIHSVGMKLQALEGRVGTAPARDHRGGWLANGLDSAQAGKPLWPDDEDLKPTG